MEKVKVTLKALIAATSENLARLQEINNQHDNMTVFVEKTGENEMRVTAEMFFSKDREKELHSLAAIAEQYGVNILVS
jgi:hypothetical protein